MFAKDLRGVYTWVSEVMLRKHKLHVRDIVGKTDREIPWSRFATLLRDHDGCVIASKGPIVSEKLFRAMAASSKAFATKPLCYARKAP